MGDNTGIEWTDATWNPVTGCAKVSQGCKHCYAERDWVRLQHLPAYAGREFTDVRTHADRLDQPLRWRRPRRIFVNSMSDLFHPDVSDEFIEEVFAVMALAKQNVFQVLTKRPDRMREHPIFSHSGTCLWVGVRQAAERLFGVDPGPMDKALPNVWLGVSVEDQAAADERIPLLLDTPAAVRWISAEPLLASINLAEHGLHGGPGQLDWVVVGGESGPKARPMHPAWARSLRDQCAAAGVPFLFKQWGEWAPDAAHGIAYEGVCCNWGGDYDNAVERVGKKLAGRLLDGVLHDGYPVASVICFDGRGRAQ
ncbi:DUF5131 family protein [Thauera humireducens]|uniref:Phage Gp37Gp68 n=1 Tax=Thauera humireducens TaxID=1134435 RepID=A0A127K416_9RHOO|nr:phage Gp37/Gp68 family protein [Thauera humireducens]AMO36703.1 hypothetical protein AC731_006970 [Thauera humireducens]